MQEQAHEHGAMAGVVERNIHALIDVRKRHESTKSLQDRIADRITRFTGSMTFVYVHLAFFGGWLVYNGVLLFGQKPFDPFPFVMLAMIASVEAIFLSTFVLISQNRSMALAERRAELDLQISLLAEHEVTRLIQMTEAIGKQLGIEDFSPSDVYELKKDVAPEEVLEQIEKSEREAG